MNCASKNQIFILATTKVFKKITFKNEYYFNQYLKNNAQKTGEKGEKVAIDSDTF